MNQLYGALLALGENTKPLILDYKTDSGGLLQPVSIRFTSQYNYAISLDINLLGPFAMAVGEPPVEGRLES
jgi:hypothetical protein